MESLKKYFEITQKEIILKINKNIYPKEVLMQAAYIHLENNYFLIDEIENQYLVYITPKTEKTLEQKQHLIYEFINELIEANNYLNQLKNTSKLRETILKKALLRQTINDEALEEIEK